ncbi:hypothetical protein AB0E61_22785 [Streptomyces catenulae]|uniref:Secreted protein n=1 Tax=Streptomyces catenulae TaxID=66875 RepID=A0ABV2Z5N6_9ACTN|nr:hypothetical protein [Streptomyces catenulae]
MGLPHRVMVADQLVLSLVSPPCSPGVTVASHTTHACCDACRHRTVFRESMPRRFDHTVSMYACPGSWAPLLGSMRYWPSISIVAPRCMTSCS